MNVYTNKKFEGVYLGGTAVVVAQSAPHAAQLLEAELEKIGLPQEIDPEEMERLSTYRPSVTILNDGNY